MSLIPLLDPHVTVAEIKAVTEILHSPRLGAGLISAALKRRGGSAGVFGNPIYGGGYAP